MLLRGALGLQLSLFLCFSPKDNAFQLPLNSHSTRLQVQNGVSTRWAASCGLQMCTTYQHHLSPRIWPVLDQDAPEDAPQTGTGYIGMWTANSVTCDLRGGQELLATCKELVPEVLTPAECEHLIAVSEKMGYAEHDLAKNTHAAVTWVADRAAVVDELFRRIRRHLPQELVATESTSGRSFRRTLSGLNERLRCYRYQPNGFHTFRKHMDDSFPASGLDRQYGNRLVWDRSDGRESSVFTFLLYLSDKFDGGETTFFPFEEDSGGSKEVTGEVRVKPRSGSVLCFYQTLRTEGNDGYFRLAPLHEGSPVLQPQSCAGSPKYVIRSDVMYTL